ncbi:hypothetical protein EV715DRAFT_249427 [Schizophyllum commune]
MAILRTRTFLVCLPLKAGVWVLALIGAMCGGGGAAGSWIEVTMLKEHPVPVQDQVSLVFQAVVFSLLGILSIFGYGLLSTLSKSVTAALIYSRLLVIHLIFTILSLIFTLYSTFRPQDQGDVKSCINGSVDEFSIEFCQKGWSTVTVLPLALFAAILFNQLCECYAIVIARSYSEDLDVVLASRFSRSLSPDFVKNDATLNNLAYGPRIV